jgi:imidazolonepropionase-like amidohydrolase
MRRLVIAFLCISLAAVAQTELSPAVHEFVKIESPTLALTHVRVIDGTGAAALDDQTVVIADGKIKSIGKSGSVEVPSDAKVIDLSGDSVIPGLVGMHDHMFYPGGGALFHEMGYSFPRLYLAGGVTTIRTTGSVEPYADLETKKLIDGGQMPGPKMHITGPYIEGKGTFAVQLHQLTGPDDARNTVNFWADQGATSFKIYNYVTRDEMKATNDAAHARKLTVTGHLCSVGFREAAALGIDDLEHGLVVDTEFY